MHRPKFLALESFKNFSFWGFIAFYLGTTWVCFEFLSSPWDVIVVCISGLVSGMIRQGLDERKRIPQRSAFSQRTAFSTKTNFFLGAILLTILSGVISFAWHAYQDMRFIGLCSTYLAAEIIAGFLNFVRQVVSKEVPFNDRPIDPPEQAGRLAPIMPKLPTMDASATLTLPREE